MILARSENVIANILANATAILLKIWSINSWVCLEVNSNISLGSVKIYRLQKVKNIKDLVFVPDW